MVLVTQFFREGSNLVLKDASDEVVGVIPANRVTMHASEEHANIMYVTSTASYRAAYSQRWDIDVSQVTSPAGPWTPATLMQKLSDDYTNVDAGSTPSDLELSLNLDAAGRLRTSELTSIIDLKQIIK